MSKFITLIVTFFITALFVSMNAFSADMGISFQLRLKSPTGVYPTESGVTMKLQILSSVSGCVLREETFSGQNVTDGSVSLSLGNGTRSGFDPNLSLNQVFDNSSVKSSLTCVDANGNSVSTNQIYAPSVSDVRTIRFSAVVGGDTIIADFPMKSVPYAVQAESVGGKSASDLIVKNPSTQLNQTNLDALLADSTKFSNLQNLANSGAAISATTAATAANFSGVVSGDVSGTQSAMSVDKIKGVSVSATAPSSGQVLQYNGSQYVPVAIPSAPVSSVAGRTGSVTLSNSDIAGLGTAAVLNAGSAANNLVQLDAGAKISAALLPSAISATSVSSTSVSTQNIYVYESTNTNRVQLKAPTSFSNYALTLPTGAGSAGQILSTDGAGNLSWASAGGVGTVTNVTAGSGLNGGSITSSGTISLANTAVMAGSYGSASSVASFTVDAQGRLSSASSTAIAIAPSQITQAAATSGQVLKWNGSAWAPAADANSGGSVTSVSSANNYLSVATGTSTPVLTANVGTVANTLAAGNDSRIIGALQSSNFNSYVAAAACTSTQSMYWNSVSSTFSCQTIGTVTNATNAVNATTAVNFSGAVSGDVSGTQSAMSVDKIKGIAVSATAPSNGQVLQYNGTQYVPVAIPSAPVSSVAGRTGTITLSNLDISGLGGAALLNVGTAAGTVAAGNDSRLTGAFQSSTALSGDLSGVLPNPVLASVVTAGTATKVTYDAKGRVTSGASLSASDIPSLDASKITSGVLPVSLGGTGSGSIAANALMMSDATGSSLSGVTCATNQVMYWTGTAWACSSLSGLLDLTIGSTQGSIMYRGASGWANLAPGTSGQFLKTNGAASNPSWSSVSSYFTGNGNNTAVPAAGNYIYSLTGIAPKTSISAANHAAAAIAVPKVGTLTNLSVTFSAAAASTLKCTLYTGATTAAMAATTIVVTGNGSATILTSSNSVAIAAGALVDLVCQNSAASTSVVPLAYSIEYITP